MITSRNHIISIIRPITLDLYEYNEYYYYIISYEYYHYIMISIAELHKLTCSGMAQVVNKTMNTTTTRHTMYTVKQPTILECYFSCGSKKNHTYRQTQTFSDREKRMQDVCGPDSCSRQDIHSHTTTERLSQGSHDNWCELHSCPSVIHTHMCRHLYSK